MVPYPETSPKIVSVVARGSKTDHSVKVLLQGLRLEQGLILCTGTGIGTGTDAGNGTVLLRTVFYGQYFHY